MQVLGLTLLIPWNKFQPGTSVFIPCVDRREMERLVRSECKRLQIKVIIKQVIENGVYGLRVWRPDDTVSSHSIS
jgi:hypothetical protein